LKDDFRLESVYYYVKRLHKYTVIYADFINLRNILFMIYT